MTIDIGAEAEGPEGLASLPTDQFRVKLAAGASECAKFCVPLLLCRHLFSASFEAGNAFCPHDDVNPAP